MSFNGGKGNKYMETHIRKRNTSRSQISESLKQLHVLLQTEALFDQVDNIQSCPFLTKIVYINSPTNPFLVDKGSTSTKLEVSNHLLDNYKSLINYILQKWIIQHLYND